MHASFNLFSMLLLISYGASQISPISLLSSETPFTGWASYSSAHPIEDLLFHEKLSYWLCYTIPQGLLHPSIFYTWSFHPSFFDLGHLVVPRTRTFVVQSRSLAVGPSNCNNLLQSLR